MGGKYWQSFMPVVLDSSKKKMELEEDRDVGSTSLLWKSSSFPDSKCTASGGGRGEHAGLSGPRISFKPCSTSDRNCLLYERPLTKLSLFGLISAPDNCFPSVRSNDQEKWKLYLRVSMSASICLDLWMSEDHNDHWLEFNDRSLSRYETCCCPSEGF